LQPSSLNPAFLSTITQLSGGPWNFGDRVLLVGDAAHAITPFYGMGMNVGFEDCTMLMDLLRKNRFDFEKTFRSFTDLRKPDTDAMTELSFKNFQSLEESPDPAYHTKWLLERRIAKLFPTCWTPTYVMIAFSHLPLREVPEIKEREERILHSLIRKHPDILSVADGALTELVKAEVGEELYLPSDLEYNASNVR